MGQCGLPEIYPNNKDALDLYYKINNQFVYDFHALQLVFDVYALQMTQDEAITLLDKLILIHGVKTKHTHDKEKQDSDRA